MYTNPTCVRELTPLLKTVSDTVISGFIRRAESKLNPLLGSRYDISHGISLATANTGTVSVTLNTDIITGTSTLFSTVLRLGDYVRIDSTGEAFRVARIDSATSFIATTKCVNTSSGGTYTQIPEEIVTASEYLSAQLLIITHFSEQAYNQDTERFNKQFEMFATPILTRLESGDYYNTNLLAQSDSKNRARLVYINTSSAFREIVDDNYDIFTSSDFK